MTVATGLPNLTVQQLDYLVAVVDAPTWADAAARLGVTPSALSQGLAEFERWYEGVITDRLADHPTAHAVLEEIGSSPPSSPITEWPGRAGRSRTAPRAPGS